MPKSSKRTRPPRPRAKAAKPRAKVPRKDPESLRVAAAVPTLTVNDMERSLAWYRDILGFTLWDDRYDREGRLSGVTMLAGTLRVMLTQDDFAKGRDRIKGTGCRLYCITRQEVDRLATAIKGRGGRLAWEPRDEPWGARDFGVTDPDGFQWTIANWEG